MKLFLVMLFFISGGLSMSQTTKSLVDENRVWSTLEIHCMPNGNNYSTYFIKFQGDTLIEGFTYSKMWYCNEPFQTNWTLYGFMREDEDRRVYVRPPNYFEGMIYDFGCEVGDTIKTWNIYLNNDTLNFVVTGVDSVLLFDGYRKKISLFEYINELEEIWVEGLGSYYGILNSGNNAYGGVCGSYHALCYEESGTLVYQHPDYGTCYYSSTVGMENIYPDNVNIYPNPAREYVNIEFRDKALKTIEIYNIKGMKILNEISSDTKVKLYLNEVDKGIYFLKINSDQISYPAYKLMVD